jgi:hypothetical protein
MKIYNYHPEYKHFVSESIADESPLEPGVYLIPAHATIIEPPNYESGTIPIFRDSYWDVIEDRRGTWYRIPTGESYEVHNPFEDQINATRIAPPDLTIYLQPHEYVWEGDHWGTRLIPEPTPAEKLKQAGLTVEELKELLGLN